MSGLALGIVLTAALFHAGWNLLPKKSPLPGSGNAQLKAIIIIVFVRSSGLLIKARI
jgi:hypothetical protein